MHILQLYVMTHNGKNFVYVQQAVVTIKKSHIMCIDKRHKKQCFREKPTLERTMHLRNLKIQNIHLSTSWLDMQSWKLVTKMAPFRLSLEGLPN